MLHTTLTLTPLLLLITTVTSSAETSPVVSPSFIAKITVTEISADGTRVEVASPKIAYLAGRECHLSVSAGDGKQLSCRVKSDNHKHPDTHRIYFKLAKSSDNGQVNILAAPTVVVHSGRPGTVFIGQEPGPAVEFKVLVSRVRGDQ